MSDKNGRLPIHDLRQGRNNVDPPQAISDTHCVEALNVDWWNATFARRRNGVGTVTLTGSPFTGTISSAYRHVPGTDPTAAELWATDDAATPTIGRVAGGTAWARIFPKDSPTGNGWDFSYASFNGLLYVAYQSAVNRLHCWDPVLGVFRRTGLLAMGVPSAADTGAGTYAATLRYYRTRAIEQRTVLGLPVVYRRSEPSPSVSWTPSGTGTGVIVTQGLVPNENETHWEVEAGTDNATFYRIATVVIATTTYTDSALVTTYANNPVSALTGTYATQKSYRYLAVDQGRILGFGSYTSTDSQNRVEFSAVLGSIGTSDGERVPLNNYQGLDENDSGPATSLHGPISGAFFAGKLNQFWKLTPTGNVTTPYSVLALSKVIGPLRHQAVTLGEDELGSSALYFTTMRGPYRWSSRGVEYIGKVVEDRTIAAIDGTTGKPGVRINLDATKVVAHTLWYSEKRQVFFWITTGTNNDPAEGLLFSVGRTPPYYGGYNTEPGESSKWSRFTGGLATARCSVSFSNTIGASMSRLLRPYIGSTSAVNTIGKCDTTNQDLGTNYQSYVITKAYQPWGDGFTGDVMGAQLEALVSTGAVITVTTLGDFNAQTTSTGTALLSAISPAGTETRVTPRVDGGVALAGLQTVQFQVGDGVAANVSWQLDTLHVTFKKGAAVTA